MRVFGVASNSFSGVSLFIIKKIHAVIYGYKLTESITAKSENHETCPRVMISYVQAVIKILECLEKVVRHYV
jgi:hypothetical protein